MKDLATILRRRRGHGVLVSIWEIKQENPFPRTPFLGWKPPQESRKLEVLRPFTKDLVVHITNHVFPGKTDKFQAHW